MDRFLSDVIKTYYLSSSTNIEIKEMTFFELMLNNTLDENNEKDTHGPVNIVLFKESSCYILSLQREESSNDLSRKIKLSPQIVARLKMSWESVESFLADATIQSKKYTNEIMFVYKSCHKRIGEVLYFLLINSTHLTIDITTFSYNLNRFDSDAINRLIALFIEMSVDINACRINGSTLFGIACQNGFHSTVEFLLKNGGDINIRDIEGASPLYIACVSGHQKIVQYLLENKAAVDLCKTDGTSPLFISCALGRCSIVNCLLLKKAAVNSLNNKGVSPLYIACQNGHYNIVELLIKNGADVNFCRKNKATPYFIANQKEHTHIVSLLVNSGAIN